MAGHELLGRAVAYLSEHGPSSPADLARHVFGGERFAPLLASLAGERLAFDGALWRLEAPGGDWAALELLATGPNPSRHRVVELAALRGAARLQLLLYSPKPVPKLLLRLGVPSPSDATEWLPPDRATEEARLFLGQRVVVGFGYVPEYLDQLLGPGWPAIDLLRLVEESDYRGRPDPVRVARHFAIPAPLSRRPGAMLEFTAALFQRLRGGRPLEELCETARPRRSRPPRPANVPDEPGVYVMSAGDGRPLYVGKSVNLKRRVNSYLRTPIALSRNMHHLMQLTERIDIVPVPSEVEALLLEGRLIREWQPPFNIQRRERRRGRFLRLSSEPFPRLTISAEPAADGGTYFGPFRHATSAARLRELMSEVLRLRTCTRRLPPSRKPQPACAKSARGACLAPCVPGPPLEPYGAEVELARRLLSSPPDEFRRELLRLLRRRPPATGAARRIKRRLEALAGGQAPG